MQSKKVKLILVLLLGTGLTGLRAQSTIPASGCNASGGGGTMSYTTGQIVNGVQTGTNGSVIQGVQQPFEISVVTGIEEAKDITLEMIVYPNPVTDFVNLKIKNFDVNNLRYLLFDINGTLMQDIKIEDQETNISMQNLSPGTYIIKVIQGNKAVKTFKVIKN